MMPEISPFAQQYQVPFQTVSDKQVSPFKQLTLVQDENNPEITTIFVVGFPDNMEEREFQNMFIFCPGYEAGSLKVPNMDDDGPMNCGKKQIVKSKV